MRIDVLLSVASAFALLAAGFLLIPRSHELMAVHLRDKAYDTALAAGELSADVSSGVAATARAVFLAQGRIDAAIALAEAAIASDPRDTQTLRELAELYADDQKLGLQRETLVALSKLRPSAEDLRKLAELYERDGAWREQKSVLGALARLGAATAAERLRYAELLAADNEPGQAVAQFEIVMNDPRAVVGATERATLFDLLVGEARLDRAVHLVARWASGVDGAEEAARFVSLLIERGYLTAAERLLASLPPGIQRHAAVRTARIDLDMEQGNTDGAFARLAAWSAEGPLPAELEIRMAELRGDSTLSRALTAPLGDDRPDDVQLARAFIGSGRVAEGLERFAALMRNRRTAVLGWALLLGVSGNEQLAATQVRAMGEPTYSGLRALWSAARDYGLSLVMIAAAERLNALRPTREAAIMLATGRMAAGEPSAAEHLFEFLKADIERPDATASAATQTLWSLLEVPPVRASPSIADTLIAQMKDLRLDEDSRVLRLAVLAHHAPQTAKTYLSPIALSKGGLWEETYEALLRAEQDRPGLVAFLSARATWRAAPAAKRRQAAHELLAMGETAHALDGFAALAAERPTDLRDLLDVMLKNKGADQVARLVQSGRISEKDAGLAYLSALAELGRRQDLRHALSRAVARSDDRFELQSLADLAERNGAMSIALAAWRNAFFRAPEDSEVARRRARLEFQDARYATAARLLEQVIVAEDGDIEDHFLSAESYWHQKRFDMAELRYRETLDLAAVQPPGDSGIHAMVEKARARLAERSTEAGRVLYALRRGQAEAIHARRR